MCVVYVLAEDNVRSDGGAKQNNNKSGHTNISSVVSSHSSLIL